MSFDQEEQQGADRFAEEDEDLKPTVDVTPPLESSPNLSRDDDDLPPPPSTAAPPPATSKLKGLFKRDKKPKEPTGKTPSDEGRMDKLKGMLKMKKKESPVSFEDPPSPQPFDPHPGGPQINPSSTLTRAPTASHNAKMTVAMYTKRPPPNCHKQGCAEVQPPAHKSMVRWSNFIVLLLVAAFLAGVLMTALAGDSAALKVMGPFFMGISLFALIGKVFFTLFWNKEAHPMLKPASKAFNKNIRKGPNYQMQDQQQMNAYSYPKSAAYNQAYEVSSPVVEERPAYMSEDDFTTYRPTGYHEEPVPDDSDDQHNLDYDEGGVARFI